MPQSPVVPMYGVLCDACRRAEPFVSVKVLLGATSVDGVVPVTHALELNPSYVDTCPRVEHGVVLGTTV